MVLHVLYKLTSQVLSSRGPLSKSDLLQIQSTKSINITENHSPSKHRGYSCNKVKINLSSKSVVLRFTIPLFILNYFP